MTLQAMVICTMVSTAGRAGAAPQWEKITESLRARYPQMFNATPDYNRAVGGLAVDPTTSDVYICMNEGTAGEHCGVYKSSDFGESWVWVDSGTAGGRSVTSGQVSVDPTTGRIAFFRVDNGTFSVILDHGARRLTLHNPNTTGFNYGAIDWTSGGLKTIIGQQHHSDGPPWVSFDGSATWANMPIGKRFGVIDATTLVRDCEFGIERSTDKGQTWTQVSTQQPLSRSVVRYGENYYWTSRDGVIVSEDKGASWSVVGNPILGAVFGPYFGMNEQSMMVVSGNGFFITVDGGTRWTQATTFMTYYAVADGWDARFNADGQHHFFSWDHRNNILYAAPSNGSAFRMVLEESSIGDVMWGVASQGARGSAGLPGNGAVRCYDLQGRVAGPVLVINKDNGSGVRRQRAMRLVVRER